MGLQREVRPLSARDDLLARYRAVRACTERLVAPLAVEDQVVQSMPEASPTKWHLGHTTWFFETFVLLRDGAPSGYRPLDARHPYVFNSYYDAVGARQPQPRRGLLSRPLVSEVLAYRRHVDDAVERRLRGAGEGLPPELTFALELGLEHEQQHQELILTDVKHLFAESPLEPCYRPSLGSADVAAPAATRFWSLAGGTVAVGHDGRGFSFDNERPRHLVHVAPFELADRLVTCREYLEFLEEGGYQDPRLWLSDGWERVQREGWVAPLYWRKEGGAWTTFALAGGRRPIAPAEPVCHVSYFEADAFARWAGARLPREEEWEVAAARHAVAGNFLESARLHPAAARGDPAGQLYGDAWEWTGSAYLPYPGYAPFEGALGEYNGKFMNGRMVLRGGSCVSPASHLRATYRNFFPPETRWQFSGIRLARDAR